MIDVNLGGFETEDIETLKQPWQALSALCWPAGILDVRSWGCLLFVSKQKNGNSMSMLNDGKASKV